MRADHASRSFDWSAALAYVDGDRELLRDVVAAFLEECPVLMRTMSEAIGCNDGPSLQRSGHVMASAMRMFGLEAAVNAAMQVEELGRSNKFAEAPAWQAELERHINALLPAATEFVKSE